MVDYIEREAAIEEAIDAADEWDGGYNPHRAAQILDGINAIPAADVRPVVRGEWLTGNDNPRTYGRIRAMCGRCGAFALAEMVNAGSYKEQLSNYCPNCGADMRPTSMSGANREES